MASVEARAYSVGLGLGAMPLVGYRGKDPGQGVRGGLDGKDP